MASNKEIFGEAESGNLAVTDVPAEEPSAVGKFFSNNLAGVYPALVAAKDAFSSFTSYVAGLVLPKLKSLTEIESKPLSAVASFFYTAVKLVLETPALFAAILIALIWKIAEVILGRREDY